MMKTAVREGAGRMLMVMDQYEHTVVRVVLQYPVTGVLDSEQIFSHIATGAFEEDGGSV